MNAANLAGWASRLLGRGGGTTLPGRVALMIMPDLPDLSVRFIERLPRGLDHVLADRGSDLSGGQRQRLAIARALYRDPRLLILDEATSALDPDSERKVQQALEAARSGRTTLIIAHRLSTVRHADAIAVIERGRVVELGDYATLMAADGPFRRLAAGQLLTPPAA